MSIAFGYPPLWWLAFAILARALTKKNAGRFLLGGEVDRHATNHTTEAGEG